MTCLTSAAETERTWFDAEAEAAELNRLYDQNSAAGVLHAALKRFGDRFAVVSSFGAESAALLHIVSLVNTALPVIFLDTGKLFGDTKRYRDQLIKHLGLTNVQTLRPDPQDIATSDPKGVLWTSDTDQCCFNRKVLPLKRALAGYDAWASGRKRFHGNERASLKQFDHSDGRVKVNPLAYWTGDIVQTYLDEHNLPKHPLVAEGFASIGCMPCTDPVGESEDARSGRWAGRSKSECGIHLSLTQNISKLNKQNSQIRPLRTGDTS